MDVTRALQTRMSTRAFRPEPVDHAVLRSILDSARWAPSGGNVQPWRIEIVTGVARSALIDAVNAAAAIDGSSQEGAYPIYPADLWEPLVSRRNEVGAAMFAQLGIERGDIDARIAQAMRNFDFFGAPVGLFFITDDRCGHGQWAHLGMLMQSVALAATERGVATCMQEAWAMRRATLKEFFDLGEHEVVYCGMAMGYADLAAPVNQFRTTRAEVDEFTTWRGFEA